MFCSRDPGANSLQVNATHMGYESNCDFRDRFLPKIVRLGSFCKWGELNFNYTYNVRFLLRDYVLQTFFVFRHHKKWF